MLADSLTKEINENNWLFVHRDNWGDLFEEVTHALYSYVLDEGDAAIDGGTNVGQNTRALARACGRSGKVFAVEAAPAMMTKTRENASSFENVKYFENALWNISGETKTFNYYPSQTGVSSLELNAGTTMESVAMAVTTVTIDDLATERVSLIKLDIEGAEYHALLGAERVMRDDKPVIVFENERQSTADRFGYSADDFFRLFESRGYYLYSVSGMPLMRENWESMMPFQFLAVHPHSPRTPRAFAATQAFLYRLRSGVWAGPR